MEDQPPSLPWTPTSSERPAPAGQRRCLWIGSVGCVTLAVLIGVLILLAKFIWGLHIEQWL